VQLLGAWLLRRRLSAASRKNFKEIMKGHGWRLKWFWGAVGLSVGGAVLASIF